MLYRTSIYSDDVVRQEIILQDAISYATCTVPMHVLYRTYDTYDIVYFLDMQLLQYCIRYASVFC
jgi:hypothetical protein